MFTMYNMLRLSFVWLYVSIFIGAVEALPPKSISDTQLDARGLKTPYDRRQGGSSFAIEGIPGGRGSDGSVPLRLEIRQLIKDTDQFNLYILALYRFQNTDQSELLSFYQIAGIHGRPFIPWDNVRATAGQDGGYCTHSSILFATWHRPYLALYEQVLYNVMQNIVNEFTGDQKTRYAQAAANFRIPYWDWAAAPPAGWGVLLWEIGGEQTIQVIMPNGTTTIPNPLWSYNFHPLSSTDFPDSPFNVWQSTVRAPTTQNANATSQDHIVGLQLTSSRNSYAQRLMNLFITYPQYGNFSNKGWIPGTPGSYDSLESLHDQLHGLLGSGGHMSVIEYSSFDPIFWLHHATVDRAFAIWQAIYPDSYVEPTVDNFGTYTIPAGSTEDEKTPLTPFHKDVNGNFWDSVSIRNTSTFGYSYPEVQWWNASVNTKQAVNALYGNNGANGQLGGRSIAGKEKRSMTQQQQRSTGLGPLIEAGLGGNTAVPVFHQEALDVLDDDANPKTYREYIANIRVSKYALSCSFFIHIFLGDFNPDPASWITDPNLVGTHTIFTSARRPGNCPSCNVTVTGTIPLTMALVQHVEAGQLDGTDLHAVEAYLTQNLHWRVTLMEGTAIPRDQVPDLKISVVTSVVTRALSDDKFPTWGPFTVLTNITNGRPAGLDHGDPS